MFIPMERHPNIRPGLDFLHRQAPTRGHILPTDTSEETHWSEIGTSENQKIFLFSEHSKFTTFYLWRALLANILHFNL